MARDEDEQQRLIREDMMCKGKAASTASARREGGSKPVCPKESEAHGPEDSWKGNTVTDGLLLQGG